MAPLWEFLFKYPRVVFAKGRLVWASPLPGWVVALVALAVVGVLVWTYLRARGKLRPHDRAVLLGLRLVIFGVLLACVLRPTLLVPTAVPQENYLAVLIDDSRSMRIADREGEPRSDWVQRTFAAEQSPVLKELGKRFRLRFFRFSSDAERLAAPGDLTFAGSRTQVGTALRRAREDLGALPLSGVVLVSDGADNSDAALGESLLALKAASLPVFTVGVGDERFAKDIEVSRVSTPREALRGSSLVVDVVIAQTGYSGQTVPLVVEDGGRIVDQQQVQLPRDGAPAVVRVRFTVAEPGPRRFHFRVSPQPGERVLENNQQETVIKVRDGRQKILYFEGEPRFEVKFIRRAVADDPQLQVVVLQRTAENKFLRLDVDSASELASGFPRTREELFSYRALVLGSVEASYFSAEQQRMIADFVGQRGGGLLMLGGRRSFAEGGYAGTPLADVLPVYLDERQKDDTTFFASLKVTPTRAGAGHAALQVAEDEPKSAARWATLPALSTFNRIGGLKPGAAALLTGAGDAFPRGQVVLAQQRYGRGNSMALAVQDSWIWQMHADIPAEDQTHELFWRQLLRWLVSDVPGRMQLTTASEHAAPGEPVQLLARVDDEAFRDLDDAQVTARITSPAGATTELPLEWSVEADGEYRATFTPAAQGMHQVQVEARRAGRLLASDTLYLSAADPDAEFFSAQMRSPLLRRIAEETGGRFYTASNLASLPDEISHSGRGNTEMEEREIWDMPIVFFLLVGLLAAEWGYRRARGLP